MTVSSWSTAENVVDVDGWDRWPEPDPGCSRLIGGARTVASDELTDMVAEEDMGGDGLLDRVSRAGGNGRAASRSLTIDIRRSSSKISSNPKSSSPRSRASSAGIVIGAVWNEETLAPAPNCCPSKASSARMLFRRILVNPKRPARAETDLRLSCLEVGLEGVSVSLFS